MDELREAFIRSRFGQGDVFARPDIEEWLEAQRKARHPDDQAWKRYCEDRPVLAHVTDAPLTTLRTYATSFMEEIPPEDQLNELFPGDILGFCGPFLRALHGARSEFEAIYYGYCKGGVIVSVSGGTDWSRLHSFHGRLPYLELTYPGSDVDQGPRLEQTIVDVLYAEWRYGRPNFRRARAFFCDALAEEIKRERAKAEHDFDTAVAVSADGTKIVHADWVVVVSVAEGNVDGFLMRHAYTLSVWPASAFTHTKILRDIHMLRTEFPQPYERWGFSAGADEILSTKFVGRIGYAVARREAGDFVRQRQIYCEVHLPSGMQRLLITASNLCPSPLPDGGVEVNV